jgi:hypothetical protein
MSLAALLLLVIVASHTCTFFTGGSHPTFNLRITEVINRKEQIVTLKPAI